MVSMECLAECKTCQGLMTLIASLPMNIGVIIEHRVFHDLISMQLLQAYPLKAINGTVG